MCKPGWFPWLFIWVVPSLLLNVFFIEVHTNAWWRKQTCQNLKCLRVKLTDWLKYRDGFIFLLTLLFPRMHTSRHVWVSYALASLSVPAWLMSVFLSVWTTSSSILWVVIQLHLILANPLWSSFTTWLAMAHAIDYFFIWFTFSKLFTMRDILDKYARVLGHACLDFQFFSQWWGRLQGRSAGINCGVRALNYSSPWLLPKILSSYSISKKDFI